MLAWWHQVSPLKVISRAYQMFKFVLSTEILMLKMPQFEPICQAPTSLIFDVSCKDHFGIIAEQSLTSTRPEGGSWELPFWEAITHHIKDLR
jgi:hypothetical protein